MAEPGDLPAVTVVIPYYNNPEGLRHVVAGVIAQRYEGAVEIVVADDGSTEPVPSDLPVQVVRQDDLGFRAAAARNLGAAVATGEVLAFFDGDTVPEPEYLAAAVPHIVRDARAVVVGSRLTGPGREEPEWLQAAWRDTDHLRRADETSWRFIISAALTVSREFFESVGGFDGSMVGYGGEDWEFAFRAWHHGATFVHEPGAIAVHDEPDWGGRGEDIAAKNAESVALAHRITHPIARPAGVMFARADVVVTIDPSHSGSFELPGALEATIAAWLAAGDVRIVVPEVPELFAAEPRVVAQDALDPAEGRITFEAVQPVLPGAIAALVDEVCEAGGRAVLTSGGVPVATATSARSRILSPDAPRRDVEVGWERVTAPVRLERRFAGW